jgi:hypothetical protein
MILRSPSTRIPEGMVVGEKPAPLVYQFLDDNGAPINIAGYTAKVNITERNQGPSIVGAAATVANDASGQVTYTFGGSEFPTAGHYRIEFWVGNGTQRFCSVIITVDVRWSLAAVPSI